jgi:hypothetical protein
MYDAAIEIFQFMTHVLIPLYGISFHLCLTYCTFGTLIYGFKPGRSRRIFQGEKILSTPSSEGK